METLRRQRLSLGIGGAQLHGAHSLIVRAHPAPAIQPQSVPGDVFLPFFSADASLSGVSAGAQSGCYGDALV